MSDTNTRVFSDKISFILDCIFLKKMLPPKKVDNDDFVTARLTNV